MSRISATASILAIAILAGSASSFAQGTGGAASGPSARTTNSAGSSVDSGSSMTTGSAGNRAGVGGTAASGPPTSSDAAIDAEDKAIDHKLKSICRGC